MAGVEILCVEDFAAQLAGGGDDGGVPAADPVAVLDGEGIEHEFAGDGPHGVVEQGMENGFGFGGSETETEI